MRWTNIMELSEKTISILKNFSSINTQLLINKGSIVRTVSPQKTILGEATIEEEFPFEFGIYELNKFLGVMSLFQDPDLYFNEHYITIKSGITESKYYFTKPDMVFAPPATTVPVENIVAEFTLGEGDYKSILQGASVLSLPEITIEGKEGDIYVVAQDTKNATKNTFERKVTSSVHQPVSFRAIISVDNLKMMPASYDVKVSAKGIVYMKSSDKTMQYWIACENNSKYE